MPVFSCRPSGNRTETEIKLPEEEPKRKPAKLESGNAADMFFAVRF
jgi:hypothetical protein